MTDLKAAAEAAKAADADPNLGAFKDAYRHFQTLATPSAILALYAERDEARERAERLAKLDREAATNVESVIAMRTRFTGMPPYVGWKGLGLALTEALDARDAAEAALASYKEEVERLKIALADAIRRPMGVIPASAEGLITYADVAAAEERRADKLRDDLTKETPDA